MRNGAKTWFVLSMSTFIWMSMSILVGCDYFECSFCLDDIDPCMKANCSGMMVNFRNGDKVVSIDCNGFDLDCTKLSECSRKIQGFPQQLKYLQLKSCAVHSSLQCDGWEATSITELCLKDHRTPIIEAVGGLGVLENLLIFKSDQLKTFPVESLKLLPALRTLWVDGNGLTNIPANTFYDAENPTSIGQNLTFLEIASNNITSLPADMFRGLNKLINISIWRNQIRQVDVNVFRGLGSLLKVEFNDELITLPPGIFQDTPLLSVLIVGRNLGELRLEEGVISSLAHLEKVNINVAKKLVLGPKALSNLPSLRILDLIGSNITELPGDLFLNSHAITSLNLRDNGIRYLPDTIFSGLTNLELLRMSNNSLVSVSKELFESLTAIKEIYLDYNFIKTLPDDLFPSHLSTLSLANNQIEDVSAAAFGSAPSLTSLDLSHNLLAWHCWMQIGGEYKTFVKSPLEHLDQLNILDLSHNKITSMCDDWMSQMTYLQKVDLSNNRLMKLSSEELNFQSGDLQVNLQNNNITTVTVDAHKTKGHDQHLKFKFGANPFNCDCHLYNLLKSLDEHTFDLTDAQCSQPQSLERVALIDIAEQRLDSLTCPLNGSESCECLFRPNKDITECTCKDTLNLPKSLIDTATMKLKLLKSQPDLTGLPKFVTELDLSGLDLKSIPNVSHTISVLNLRNNRLEVIPIEILNKNITLMLENNSLQCDCWGTDNVRNLQKFQRNIWNYSDLLCSDGAIVKGKHAESLCDVYYATWIGCSCIVAGIIIATAIVLMYKFLPQVQVILFNCGCKRIVKEEWLDSGKKYDIFLSYTMRAVEDQHFVLNILLPKLEQLNYKVCEHTRDFEIGQSIPDQIYTSVANSKRTLFVISNTFLQNSVWVLEEFNATIVQGAKDRRNRAVIIILGDVDVSKAPATIKHHLELNTYIKWDAEDESFWKRLQKALPKKLTAAEMKKRRNALKAVKALGTGRGIVVNEDGRLVIATDLNNKVETNPDRISLAALAPT